MSGTERMIADLFTAADRLTEAEYSKLRSIIGMPTKVNGLYWLVTGTACAILVLCVLRLTGIFHLIYPALPAAFWDSVPNEDKITGVFTTVLSFLIGMFVPSPVTGQSSQGA